MSLILVMVETLYCVILEESLKKNPFPCPCTIKTALTYYVDICAPVKSHVLKALAAYACDEEEKKRLILLSTANEVGLVSEPEIRLKPDKYKTFSHMSFEFSSSQVTTL